MSAQARVIDLHQRFADARNAFGFAVDYLDAVLRQPKFRVFSDAPIYWEMRFWLPYVVHPLDDQQNLGIVLNCNYKPVGMTSREYVEYEGFPNLHMPLAGKWRRNFPGQSAQEAYLFKDGSRPWSSRRAAKDYLDTLRKMDV